MPPPGQQAPLPAPGQQSDFQGVQPRMPTPEGQQFIPARILSHVWLQSIPARILPHVWLQSIRTRILSHVWLQSIPARILPQEPSHGPRWRPPPWAQPATVQRDAGPRYQMLYGSWEECRYRRGPKPRPGIGQPAASAPQAARISALQAATP